MNYIPYILSRASLLIFFLFGTFTTSILNGQNKTGVITTEFKFNDTPFPDGKRLQQSLEYAISQNEVLKVVDRERLGSMRKYIQGELNLRKDFNSSFNDSLNIFGASYVAYGDVTYSYGSDYYRVIISFVKISGEDVSERFPVTVKIDHDNVQNYSLIDSLFTDGINELTDTYFVKGEYNYDSIPSIIKKVEKQDSVIKALEVNLVEAISEIKDLNDQLGFVNSLSFGIQVAFDSINKIDIDKKKLPGVAIGVLSPSIDNNYSLHSGESFISLTNDNNGIIQYSNSKAVWYYTRLSLFEKSLIDIDYEKLRKYKGLYVQFRNFRLPNKHGYGRMNVAVNGKTVISNSKIQYKVYSSEDGFQQIMFEIEDIMDSINR